MARVELAEILNAMEMPTDEMQAFVDKQTGQVLTVWHDVLRVAEEGEGLADGPGWEPDDIEQAAAILNDASGRFVRLPDRFDIDEWEMMRQFTSSVEDGETAESLARAIHGRGAFRRFKDCVHERGVADQWYKFRDEQYRRVAADWCEGHGIETDADAE